MNLLTKIFIVMTTVFALTGMVFISLILVQEDKYRSNLQDAQIKLYGAMANNGVIQGNLDKCRTDLSNISLAKTESESNLQLKIRNQDNEKATLEREIASAKNDLNNAQASVTALTTANQAMTNTLGNLNTELGGLRKDVPVLTERNAELNRKNNELQTQVEADTNAIRRLQEELAASQEPAPQKSSSSTGPGQNQTPTLSAVVPINGKVSRVDTLNGRTYITIALGKRDGVQENFRFTVYRGNSYIGDAVVRQVAPDESVAEVTVLKPGQVVVAADLAISGINP